jgi:hypothetical protein
MVGARMSSPRRSPGSDWSGEKSFRSLTDKHYASGAARLCDVLHTLACYLHNKAFRLNTDSAPYARLTTEYMIREEL